MSAARTNNRRRIHFPSNVTAGVAVGAARSTRAVMLATVTALCVAQRTRWPYFRMTRRLPPRNFSGDERPNASYHENRATTSLKSSVTAGP